MEFELSSKQKEIAKQIVSWFNNKGSKYLTLGGYAGTGKTTLIGYISQLLRDENPDLTVAFCSYTGKASRILERKLNDFKAVYSQDSVSTIHRLIYEAVLNDNGEIIGWKRREIKDFKYNLIVVDEASMINEYIWNDLLMYGVPILAVGDHGQLPPIEGRLNLMAQPDLVLEEIFRQEENNPIIYVSEIARHRGNIPFIDFGPTVKKMKRNDSDTQEFLKDLFMSYDDEFLVLVGYNNTRVKLNKAIRGLLDFEGESPSVKDRVICLRNNHERQIYNGMMGRIKKIEQVTDDWGVYYNTDILFDGAEVPFSGLISYNQFGSKETLHNEKTPEVDLFDFGYALTVHKAQGSQAKKVVIFEERFSNMDEDSWRRWLYTAVTRASEELYIIG